jgi:UDP-glucose 4-epimerase
MEEAEVKNLVFSSSATVYGDPSQSPLSENSTLGAVNPYGQTKLTTEYLFKDLQKANSDWNVALLRYFNPVGAHESGEIGEDPSGIPNNLMPYVTQVAVGKREKLNVFGDDYPTRDGTGERDYIHVVDLAKGHLKALEYLAKNPGLVTYNLGTGKGYTVLELVKTFEEVNDVSIPYEIAPRRAGDAASCYADPSKVERELGWKTERGLKEMCRDAWNWQQKNPNGY